jgi:hypothetical protein
MTTPRRDFLGLMGLAALGAPPLVRASSSRSIPPIPRDAEWDMSWVSKVSGKVKLVLDMPDAGDGYNFGRGVRTAEGLAEVYGLAPSEVSTVVVIRHEAIDLIMNDSYWERFEIGKALKLPLRGETEKFRITNPIATAAPDAPPARVGSTMTGFLAAGGVILACNLAFSMVIARYRRADSLSREDATAKAKENIVPGVILMPTGLVGLIAAQHEGCALLKP